MNARIELASQVVQFIAAQAPEPRRALRLALRELQRGRGDIKALERELDGYFRLRVRNFRIVFTHDEGGGPRVLRCLFAERRDLVYALFEELLRRQQISEEGGG